MHSSHSLCRSDPTCSFTESTSSRHACKISKARHESSCALQELQNSILDLNRQLYEAKDRENTLLAVERQHKADSASLTAQVSAAEQRVADTDHKLAVVTTDLKVSILESWVLTDAC